VVVRTSYFSGGEVFPSHTQYYALRVEADPPETTGARIDRETGRVVLSTAVRYAVDRWAFYALVLGLLAIFSVAVIAIVRRLLAPWATARRVAREGAEVELEVVELLTHDVHDRPAILEVRYRAPPPDRERPRAYRVSARDDGGELRSERFALTARPLLLAEDARVLALASGDRAVLVREDFWPLALDDAQRREAAERLARPSTRSLREPAQDERGSGRDGQPAQDERGSVQDGQPASVPASAGTSSIGMHEPSRSKT
jgi:hypothetical protein